MLVGVGYVMLMGYSFLIFLVFFVIFFLWNLNNEEFNFGDVEGLLLCVFLMIFYFLEY